MLFCGMNDLSKEDIEQIVKTTNQKVGGNIKRIREEKGLTQVELAAKTLSDRQYIYKIETAKVGLSIAKLAVIAKALNVKIALLVEE